MTAPLTQLPPKVKDAIYWWFYNRGADTPIESLKDDILAALNADRERVEKVIEAAREVLDDQRRRRRWNGTSDALATAIDKFHGVA